jgi:PAS domain S-box-containing protein
MPKASLDDVSLPGSPLFSTAPGGFLFTATDGQIIHCNETLAGWLGYRAGELNDGERRLGDLITRGGQLYYETHFRPLLQLQERVEEINLTLRGRGDRRVPVLVSAGRYRWKGDRDILMFIFIRYTQRQRYEEELRKAKQQAESSDRAKSYFLSTISHEVLTPINAIMGMADLLRSSGLTEGQQRLESVLTASANHLLELFQNVLVVAKGGLDRLEIAQRSFDLRRLATSVTDSFRYSNRRPQLSISLSVAEDIPPLLVGDPTLITQLLTNLLGNAVKFTEAGTVRLQIDRGPVAAGRVPVHFLVSDTGAGLAQEEAGRLFEPFQQLNEGIHTRYGGSGLGLAICQSILQRHGSELKVESEPGRGARFYFSLNLPAAHATTAADREPSELPAIGRGRCLLVEDNKTNAYLVAQYLKRWGVAYDIATDGQRALDLLNDNRYELVLMDLQMPVLDGYRTSQAIRKAENSQSRVPIVAFSAAPTGKLDERMRNAGFDAFIPKPFVPEQLYAILSRYLSPGQSLRMPPAPHERYPRIEEAFEGDPGGKVEFIRILQRELYQAAEELDRALADGDSEAVAALKHRLKTSLRLVEAPQLAASLVEATTLLRAGKELPEGRGPAIVSGLRDRARQLDALQS